MKLRWRVRFIGLAAIATILGVFAGCSGVSSGGTSSQQPPAAAQLSVSPSALSFGNVAVGQSSTLNGTLTASNSEVIVSSASWSGSGYSVSGITFPVTIGAGKSVGYSVTFAPASAGNASGSISFASDASDATLTQTFAGDGTQSSAQHTVALSWDSSTSTVAGYNVYRGTQSGGPYSKVNSSLVLTTSYTDASVVSGTTYYYVSTAVASNNVESGYSNQATAAVP
jgi:Abnormal spindle-like microcephaly-assoc'd, ASPM-SPD-2-Hydin